jgi:hypothetical protein
MEIIRKIQTELTDKSLSGNFETRLLKNTFALTHIVFLQTVLSALLRALRFSDRMWSNYYYLL